MYFDRQVPMFWTDTATSIFRLEEYITREEIRWIQSRDGQHWGNELTSDTKWEMTRERGHLSHVE